MEAEAGQILLHNKRTRVCNILCAILLLYYYYVRAHITRGLPRGAVSQSNLSIEIC